ncbi:MAG: PleD family two-component system response regulator [Bacteriovoracaceae bacterium]
MNHPVLLADDSITIQKVIKITLANQPYDITDCSSDEELFQKLPVIKPKIVFLDFNLSENYTGYELCSKIHSILPNTKILLLLGTFDTVEDAQMEKCGASEKIVKPFDSNKFIAICRQLIESADEGEEIPYPQAKAPAAKAPPVIDESPDNQWQMSHAADPFIQSGELAQPEPEETQEANALNKEMNDWGMSIPGVIGKDKTSSGIELPPIISEAKVTPAAAPASQEVKVAPVAPAVANEQKFPESNDLDYPTLESFVAPKEEEKPSGRKPQLVSIESLNQDALDLELEGNYVEDKSDIGSLEAQIHDEVADDLWQADEFEDLKAQVSAKIEEMKTGFQPSRNDFDESLFKPMDDAESVTWNDVNSDIFAKPKFEPTAATQIPDADEIMKMLRPEMEDLVKKYVKEYMDDMFKKNVEKVSWEVIPDLAENLIRQELSKISEKIIGQTK